MQIVIDIHEKDYKSIMNRGYVSSGAVYAIMNGIPLPKGHGRLIDADALDRGLSNAQVNLDDALSEAFDDGLTWASEVASKLQTIIEADKGNE